MARKGGSKDGKKFDEDMERRRRLSKMNVYTEPEKAPAGAEYREYRMREAAYQQEIAELKLKISNMKGGDSEAELRQKVEELNNIKDSYSKKMKNTVALQRLKYEKELASQKRYYKNRIQKLKGKETPEEPAQDDYDKLKPEEKLLKITERADELYLQRAGMLYKGWHAEMADKMSLTGIVGLTSVSLNRFEEKATGYLKALREKEKSFKKQMEDGYPDVALDAYFSQAMVVRLANAVEFVPTDSMAYVVTPGMAAFENRMNAKKDELKTAGANALKVRDAFMYEVDLLADELRKKKQLAP